MRRINVYTAEPGSASEEALNLLASWASSRGWSREPQDVVLVAEAAPATSELKEEQSKF